MKLIDQLKKAAGDQVVNQALAAARIPAVPVSFNEALKVAILFYARSEAEMTAVNDLISFLWDHKKLTFILGGTSGFPVPKSKFTNMNFIQLKEDEFNWKNIPTGYRIDNYLENKFDILIDLSQEDYQPLIYILAVAKARIKVGRYDRNIHGIYHFMLDTWQKPDIYNFTEQIKQYLLSL